MHPIAELILLLLAITTLEETHHLKLFGTKTSNDQPYTTGISLQKLDNGNLIVGSSNGNILQFDNSGDYLNVFQDFSQTSSEHFNTLRINNSNNIIACFNSSGYNASALEIDQSGNIIQSNSISFGQTLMSDFINTSDGNYLAAGNNNCCGQGGFWDARLNKYSSSFNSLYNNLFCFTCSNSGIGDEITYELIEHSNAYYVCGYYADQSSNPRDGFIIKTNTNGSQEWMNKYGSNNSEEWLYSIKGLSNGNIVSVGFTTATNAGDKDAYVVCVDPNGNVVWTQTFGSNSDEVAEDLIITQNGNLLFTGKRTNNSNQIQLFAVNMDVNGMLIGILI